MYGHPRGFMGKREPQIILKTDERKIHFELGLEGKFAAKSSGWDENRVFLEGDKLDVALKNGRWVPTTCRRGGERRALGSARAARSNSSRSTFLKPSVKPNGTCGATTVENLRGCEYLQARKFCRLSHRSRPQRLCTQ
jgi:hypothetical protein